MSPRPFVSALLLLIAFAGTSSGAARAADHTVVEKLPAFKLKDPAGGAHTEAALKERGAVLIVTIPNVKHAPLQDRWARFITRAGWKKDGPLLAFLEDMTQTAVPGASRENLAKRFEPGKNPLILLDETAAVRKALGVAEDDTVVLVIDKTGKIVHVTGGEPDIEPVKALLAALSKIK